VFVVIRAHYAYHSGRLYSGVIFVARDRSAAWKVMMEKQRNRCREGCNLLFATHNSVCYANIGFDTTTYTWTEL
jgi:hypothetical protein